MTNFIDSSTQAIDPSDNRAVSMNIFSIDPNEIVVGKRLRALNKSRAWIQVSSATVELKAAISSAMASAGVLHPSVFLGLPFRSQATSFSHV